MKILAISNLYPPDVDGGYELGCAQAVEALRAAGHDVRVLTATPRRPVPPAPGVHRDLTLANVYDRDLGEPRDMGRLRTLEVAAMWVDAANTHRTLTHVREFEPDVVYLWNLVGLGGLGLGLALQQAGVPWVWHLMDQVPAILSGLRDRPRPALAGLFSHRLTGTYISCSEHVLYELERQGVTLGGRVEIIPNWVTGKIAPRSAGSAREGPLRIAMASAVSRYKGVDIMMRAAALLRARGITEFRVDVYGRLVDHSLVALAEELELGACLTLKGEVPQAQLMQAYEGYDLFAFPAWEREPFGFAALEAAARGCAVLLTHGGVAEWLVDGVHCLKAERTPEAFAGRIADAISGRVDIRAIAARGQMMVLHDLHLDAVLPRIEAVLRETAETGAPGTARDYDRAHLTAVLAERFATAVIAETTAR